MHFELNDEKHAKQLYDEMVETLIGLKNEKTLKVLLSCSAGLTTAMFAENLNTMADLTGIDYHFYAVPYLNIYEEVEKYDIVLIAPQIGYIYERLKNSLHDKLVLQIPTALLASYDAMATLNFIRKELDLKPVFRTSRKVKRKKNVIVALNIKIEFYLLLYPSIKLKHAFTINYMINVISLKTI